MANVSPEIVLGMLFLILSGADIDFLRREVQWRTYATHKALPTIKRSELVFAAAALDPEHETFVVHVTSFSSTPLTNADVHSSCRPQIASLIAKKASTKVPTKYANFADVLSSNLAFKLLKYTGINNYTIELVDANGFIRLSKSPKRYRCFKLRRYPPGQSVKSDRRRKERLPRHLSRC